MRFLIVKTSSIGDIIQTFPVVEYLKKKKPSCLIDWVVEEEFSTLLESHPQISKTIRLPLRRWKRAIWKKENLREIRDAIANLRQTPYDVVFDLQGNTKSALVTSLTKAQKKVGFGWLSVAEWPSYFATNERFTVPENSPIQERYLSVVQQFFQDKETFISTGVDLILNEEEKKQLTLFRKEGKQSIMIAFGSRWKNKQLSYSTLVQFLKKIEERSPSLFYFVSGNVQEHEAATQLKHQFPGSISLEKVSFPLWQHLMKKVDLVITADSAALALCGTTNTPSFSFFGPTQAKVYKPLGKHHHYQGSCPYGLQFARRCPRLRSCKSGACLKEARVEDLVKSYKRVTTL